MPSGLTYKIYSGEDMSLRGFALKCVTHLGAGYRASNHGEDDLPLDKPPVLKIDEYYQNQLQQAKEDLIKFSELKEDREKALSLYLEEIKQHKEFIDKCNTERRERKERYLEMLKKVESWSVPEEYTSLKNLMMNQIKGSCDFDCIEVSADEEQHVSLEEWLDSKIDKAVKDVDYYTETLRKEALRVEEDTKYLQGLYKAINMVEPYEKKE